MTQTNYHRGRAAEYYVKHLLEGMGYRFIIRSAGSHTPIDLLAAGDISFQQGVIAVQVKGGTARITETELRKLRKWAKAFGAVAVLAKKKGERWILEVEDRNHPTRQAIISI